MLMVVIAGLIANFCSFLFNLAQIGDKMRLPLVLKAVYINTRNNTMESNMRRFLAVLGLVMVSSFALAQSNSAKSCHQMEGMWVGKFSYVNPENCELGDPNLCKNVGLAIGVRFDDENNEYMLDLYPQRGVAGTIRLSCVDNNTLRSNTLNAKGKAENELSINCDKYENCFVNYNDGRLAALLVKIWQEDIRI